MPADTPPILTITMNPALDRTSEIAALRPREKLRCSEPVLEPGGGGINVARAIRKLGGPARALWTRGGATGELLERLLDQCDLDHEAIDIEGLTRHGLMVHDEANDQLYRFGLPGPEITGEEAQACLDRCLALDPPPDYLVASGSLPPGAGEDFYAKLARGLPGSVRLVVDTRQQALERAVEAGVFLIKPNLRELREITGRELPNDHAIEQAARSLITGGGARYVLVSLGAGGALLVGRDSLRRIRAPTVQIQSKVGAGDSTVAGLVYALARGDAIEVAARFAVAAGAAAVMTPGTQLCRGEDVDRLFEEMS